MTDTAAKKHCVLLWQKINKKYHIQVRTMIFLDWMPPAAGVPVMRYQDGHIIQSSKFLIKSLKT